MKKTLRGYFKGFNKQADLVDFIASTDSIDREGESIDPKGWDLSNIGKNLPLLWAHNDRELPIGKVVSARIEGNALIATVEFAHKLNDFAKKVYDMVVGGFLNAVSVGFMPKAFDATGKMVSQELLELSVVNIPANQDAMRSNAFKSFQKSLELNEEKADEVVVDEKTKTKTPACMMSDETKDQCVARKIPEIKKENPDMSQDQCVAMAEEMCSKACEEEPADDMETESKDVKYIEAKEGRVISEKNRNTMRIAIDSMRQAAESLSELLNATEPPAKKGDVLTNAPVSSGREKRILDKVRLMDKVGEAIIHELKNGGE